MPDIDLAALDGTDGFRIDERNTGDRVGFSVSDAGDVNRDGFADILVGADEAGNGGEAYIILGRADGFGAVFDPNDLVGPNGTILDGPASGARLGFSVGGAGDIDGDGYDDAATTSIFSNTSGFVVYGKPDGFSRVTTLDPADGRDVDRIIGSSFTANIDGAGDFDGDGYADVIFGETVGDSAGGPNRGGQAIVLYGGPAGLADDIRIDALTTAQGFALTGSAADELVGGSVAGAGDVNGDGYADIVIGAIGLDGAADYTGGAYVVLGRPGTPPLASSLGALDGSDGFRLSGRRDGRPHRRLGRKRGRRQRRRL